VERQRVWKGVEGCGRVWKGVEGCGRVWKGVEGCGRVWTDSSTATQGGCPSVTPPRQLALNSAAQPGSRRKGGWSRQRAGILKRMYRAVSQVKL
jgi:hypothetical protein